MSLSNPKNSQLLASPPQLWESNEVTKSSIKILRNDKPRHLGSVAYSSNQMWAFPQKCQVVLHYKKINWKFSMTLYMKIRNWARSTLKKFQPNAIRPQPIKTYCLFASKNQLRKKHFANNCGIPTRLKFWSKNKVLVSRDPGQLCPYKHTRTKI